MVTWSPNNPQIYIWMSNCGLILRRRWHSIRPNQKMSCGIWPLKNGRKFHKITYSVFMTAWLIKSQQWFISMGVLSNTDRLLHWSTKYNIAIQLALYSTCLLHLSSIIMIYSAHFQSLLWKAWVCRAGILTDRRLENYLSALVITGHMGTSEGYTHCQDKKLVKVPLSFVHSCNL
jgi:hypothetical protein